ncbi:HpcH/HpaI aldolase family protein [Roseinatronobacter monicus]|uniref:2,4-dihydroxyhept-2-enedioate aldolase n=1 Tax=Roseinatronobacter monicus TaxID=393481 RepID=A0A543KFP5_9RHOB|nr:aldolase/citrate lyase family protein [Roseinatronobacter monicus]TQM93901.1 2,4-dihydroxyhept-2-enedioate aldolase [Roseinatronobacter monicus]
MQSDENRFKTWMQTKGATPPLGSWIMSASPLIAEAMGYAGYDWLLVDMEHSPIDLAQTTSILQALSGTPSEVVLRVPWNDPVMVKRVMDAGARSIMFPFIQSVDEARAAIAATRYPPQGTRGVAAMHRASRFGTAPDYLARANDQVAVILQLETPEAVALLPEIAALDGVDAVFVGPGDLSGSMGLLGQINHADVQTALRDAAQAARRAGIACGIVGADPAKVRSYIEMGFSYVAIASDLALLMGAAKTAAASVRGQAAPQASGSAY